MSRVIQKASIYAVAFILVIALGVDVFYILYNAEWLIGDDAFMLRHTAFGLPFLPSESILPEDGFFRPFNYIHENLVLLFHSGMHDAFEHYIINVVSFLLCIGAVIGTLWLTIKPKKVIDYAIIVFGTILVASRIIGIYINIYGPIFNVYTYHALAILFLTIFMKNDKVWSMLLSLFFWGCSMLVYENVCMVVGCMGLFPLLFAYKRLNRRQIMYCFTLLGFVIAFAAAYLFIIYLPSAGQTTYDPTHGTGLSIIDNAKQILKGQKFIWVAAAVWMWRQVQLGTKKSDYHILHDTLLWAAGGMVFGGIVLRLNWTMYYYDAIIVSLPAVVYFLLKIHDNYGRYITFGVVTLFACWHSYNLPRTFANNQKDRIDTAKNMESIAEKAANGWSVIWCENGELDGFDNVLREWKKETTMNYMQYLMQDKEWSYDQVERAGNIIVFYANENDIAGDIPDLLVNYERIPIGETSGMSYFIIDKTKEE